MIIPRAPGRFRKWKWAKCYLVCNEGFHSPKRRQKKKVISFGRLERSPSEANIHLYTTVYNPTIELVCSLNITVNRIDILEKGEGRWKGRSKGEQTGDEEDDLCEQRSTMGGAVACNI